MISLIYVFEGEISGSESIFCVGLVIGVELMVYLMLGKIGYGAMVTKSG